MRSDLDTDPAPVGKADVATEVERIRRALLALRAELGSEIEFEFEYIEDPTQAEVAGRTWATPPETAPYIRGLLAVRGIVRNVLGDRQRAGELRVTARTRSRAVRFAAAGAAIALLFLSAASSVSAGRARAREEIDGALSRDAAQHAQVLEAYFERARSLILLASQDAVYRDLASGSTALNQRAADRGLLYIAGLYPGQIGEACLIDLHGRELARVTKNIVAPFEELSPDETGAPFFAPTLALQVGEVYQAAPYVSPDTDEVVISNSTLVLDDNGAPSAILHFEVTLDSFRSAMGVGASWDAIVTADGVTVVDSRRPLQAGVLPSAVNDRRFAAATIGHDLEGHLVTGGLRTAFHRIEQGPANANRWVFVASTADSIGAWNAGLTPLTAASAVFAVLLLFLVTRSFRNYERELETSALTDDLTGLPNRLLLFERAGPALVAARRDGRQTAMLLLDLDRFKEINDTLGHHFGDLLLQQMGPRIMSELRSTDMVARLGGDEFAVLMPAITGVADTLAAAERIRVAIGRPIQIEELSFELEVSIGVAVAPEHADTVNHLLQRADVAMYLAKQTRSGVALYDSGLDDHNPRKLALLSEFREAINQGQLILHYQSKDYLPSGDLCGVEALVRWDHPERGLVYPDEFIGLVENTALIHPLTTFVLDLALAQARTWLDSGREISVAVNISARSLLDLELPAAVMTVLRHHGVPPRLLTLEITESAIMGNPGRAREILLMLSDMGVQLAIDDFGTGYSSLAYLKTLPVHELKIDRSFVLNMVDNPNDAIIVRSVVDLGHNLGLRVVAEGVETEETARQLSNAGCTVAQGYLWGGPAPAADLDTYFERFPPGRDLRRSHMRRSAVPAPSALTSVHDAAEATEI